MARGALHDWQRQPSESPEGIQAMLNALPAMVGYWDSELRNRMANDAYIYYFGKTPAEIRGIHVRELLGKELYEKNRRHIEGALLGEPQLFDREITTPSGEVRYTQTSYIPDVVESGVRGFFVLVTDITERRRIEEEVERSRARLAEAERVARMGSWEWDIPSGRLTCSEGLFAIYGTPPQEFENYDPSETRNIHPDDRTRVEQELRQAVERGTPVDFEFRIIRPDGRVRRIHSRAELIADSDGHPLRLTGSVQDVTEVRAAAEALHQTATDLGRRAAELNRFPHRSRSDDLTKALTPRQVEILALIAEGLSNAEIASRLYLTESTVKWHVRKILRALGVTNRAQAVARYLSTSS
ncbi:MAG TPA: PAS domain-containing protein [Solirubrobacterales bacterium]|nr:PAS domain-containing protein [Solirubrobacterales bacterium]